MSSLNQAFCASSGGNTGIDDCSLTLKNIVRGFLVPKSFELTAAQLADPDTALAALIAATKSDNASLRVYPLPEVVGITDSSEDVVLQTLGYGTPVPVRQGNYNLTFAYLAGGNCVNGALQKFNQGNYRYLGVDAGGVLFGVKSGTSLKGIPLDYFNADKFKFADGTNVTGFAYRISFKPEYLNGNLGFVQMDLLSLMEIDGLHNVVLVQSGARALGVFKVLAMTGCAGTNMYDLYDTELASAALWKVTEAGKDITITSVVADPNIKGFTITMSTADPDYVAGGPFFVTLQPVSILEAAGVVGFEGLTLKVA